MKSRDVTKLQQQFFRDTYGVELSPAQVRRYRLVMADVESAYSYLYDRLGDSAGQADQGWLSSVTAGSPGLVEEFDVAEPEQAGLGDVASAAHRDYQAWVLGPFTSGDKSTAYQGMARWMDRWVGPKEAMVRVRASLNQDSRTVLERAGLVEPSDKPRQEGSSKASVGSLLKDPVALLEMLNKRLSATDRVSFAERVAAGSPAYQDLAKEKGYDLSKEDDRNNSFFEAWTRMRADLDAIQKRAGKQDDLGDSLSKWLERWTTAESRGVINRHRIVRRFLKSNNRTPVSTFVEDRDMLQVIKNGEGLPSMAQTISHIIDEFCERHGYKRPAEDE